MTSIGKGRGWARATDHETVLRRPGQSISPKTSEIQQLVNKIKHLSLDAASLNNFIELMTFLENQSEDERTAYVYISHQLFLCTLYCSEILYCANSCRNLDKLWQNILEDRYFGVKYTELCLGRDDKNYINKSLLEPIRRSLYSNTQTSYNSEFPRFTLVKNIFYFLGLC